MSFQSNWCEMSGWTFVLAKVLLSRETAGGFLLDCIRSSLCSIALVLHRAPFPLLPHGCIPHISAASHLPVNPSWPPWDELSALSLVLLLACTAFTHPWKQCPSFVMMACLIGTSDSHSKLFMDKGSASLHPCIFSSEHSSWHIVGFKGMRSLAGNSGPFFLHWFWDLFNFAYPSQERLPAWSFFKKKPW